ncbi:hypothetical protein [Pseudomonas sp.]|uniref:hypothetical protein n=1 Tax=Pseudomonas sp. TaxID=306 RepID=UPI004053CD12
MNQKATCITLSSLLESKNPPSAGFFMAFHPWPSPFGPPLRDVKTVPSSFGLAFLPANNCESSTTLKLSKTIEAIQLKHLNNQS